MKTALLLLSILFFVGCDTTHSVFVDTGTVLGISVAENPGTGLYEARLGYARSEFAYVPTVSSTNASDVIKQNVPNVLVEIRMENLFRGGLVYQRLAVGDVAVKQHGAALLFSKSPDGKIDPTALNMIRQLPAP